jgi:crotonobetainyl-CoA:carnitine CoA-transferase CaiB-like acyl-CoA transferase
LLNAEGVPSGEVLSVPEALAHPQVTERELVRTFPSVDRTSRDVSVVRAGFRLASGDPAPKSPPPVLGADTDALLAELGYGDDEVGALHKAGAV